MSTDNYSEDIIRNCFEFQVAVSTSHIVALTSEMQVYTWGDGRRGQLGHGELETWRSRPEAVESLKASFIYYLDAFWVFLTTLASYLVFLVIQGMKI
jgi:alpha-tubulin suppressor-like RCC1 family protein